MNDANTVLSMTSPNPGIYTVIETLQKSRISAPQPCVSVIFSTANQTNSDDAAVSWRRGRRGIDNRNTTSLPP
jgi:hypothetical protein